jgi:hypothetical protein
MVTDSRLPTASSHSSVSPPPYQSSAPSSTAPSPYYAQPPRTQTYYTSYQPHSHQQPPHHQVQQHHHHPSEDQIRLASLKTAVVDKLMRKLDLYQREMGETMDAALLMNKDLVAADIRVQAELNQADQELVILFSVN